MCTRRWRSANAIAEARLSQVALWCWRLTFSRRQVSRLAPHARDIHDPHSWQIDRGIWPQLLEQTPERHALKSVGAYCAIMRSLRASNREVKPARTARWHLCGSCGLDAIQPLQPPGARHVLGMAPVPPFPRHHSAHAVRLFRSCQCPLQDPAQEIQI